MVLKIDFVVIQKEGMLSKKVGARKRARGDQN